MKKKKHTIHIRNLDDKTYKELWSLRHYIGATNWTKVIQWAIEKYKTELELLEVFP